MIAMPIQIDAQNKLSQNSVYLRGNPQHEVLEFN